MRSVTIGFWGRSRDLSVGGQNFAKNAPRDRAEVHQTCSTFNAIEEPVVNAQRYQMATVFMLAHF